MAKYFVEKPVYFVGLVAEQHYQPAVTATTEGHFVQLVHETGNPYDDRAICAIDHLGRILGYLPRNHWLTDALLDEGKGVRVRIKEKRVESGGHVGLLLEATMDGDPIGEQAYSR